ncbi:hypothetical protein BIW11_02451 [Tropilaelaps mercedesae]|uniref:Uncharacterized protein n=1 Tax=Tropilaelaps mercedesae TaxID=418985 RepID=A0A1V9Y2U9_9ACAR|nr:hypothetical protein BIW11_02451 [Tropilaelaps mercedesae]
MTDVCCRHVPTPRAVRPRPNSGDRTCSNRLGGVRHRADQIQNRPPLATLARMILSTRYRLKCRSPPRPNATGRRAVRQTPSSKIITGAIGQPIDSRRSPLVDDRVGRLPVSETGPVGVPYLSDVMCGTCDGVLGCSGSYRSGAVIACFCSFGVAVSQIGYSRERHCVQTSESVQLFRLFVHASRLSYPLRAFLPSNDVARTTEMKDGHRAVFGSREAASSMSPVNITTTMAGFDLLPSGPVSERKKRLSMVDEEVSNAGGGGDSVNAAGPIVQFCCCPYKPVLPGARETCQLSLGGTPKGD